MTNKNTEVRNGQIAKNHQFCSMAVDCCLEGPLNEVCPRFTIIITTISSDPKRVEHDIAYIFMVMSYSVVSVDHSVYTRCQIQLLH